jgi:hypothetical protein
MRGTIARVTKNGPVRLAARTLDHSASLVSRTDPLVPEETTLTNKAGNEISFAT